MLFFFFGLNLLGRGGREEIERKYGGAAGVKGSQNVMRSAREEARASREELRNGLGLGR